MGDERINLDYISKWRWALAQMAQYCIDNRLRTPLGKPAETFLKFESNSDIMFLFLIRKCPYIILNKQSTYSFDLYGRGSCGDEKKAELKKKAKP
ncbi:unnamed protein product [Anisakis simplex]|uniref:Uncharacterized protein n=1 Tax=Anisakis simplex TaxID=6269 RepID=A0A0M3JP15_ANISI|nr:unnamed protein product [Anisakis simplex]